MDMSTRVGLENHNSINSEEIITVDALIQLLKQIKLNSHIAAQDGFEVIIKSGATFEDNDWCKI